MYLITPKNIYLRYLAGREAAQGAGGKYTYKDMAKTFMVTPQACYDWTRTNKEGGRSPSGPRRMAVLDWLNDGTLDKYLERRKGAAKN